MLPETESLYGLTLDHVLVLVEQQQEDMAVVQKHYEVVVHKDSRCTRVHQQILAAMVHKDEQCMLNLFSYARPVVLRPEALLGIGRAKDQKALDVQCFYSSPVFCRTCEDVPVRLDALGLPWRESAVAGKVPMRRLIEICC